ncbi:MAG: metal-sulfur cluster assembly factor [Ramlibacter sp.]|nr:metal-sulfur cluster assembly factor [Ramlibacter sp.]
MEIIARSAERFEYEGPDELREVVTGALHQVVDPEVALDIVEVGLVYHVHVPPAPQPVQVRMTMTSAACPVADVIMEDVQHYLAQALPDREDASIDLVWEPAWTPERLSTSAKRFMGW